MDEVFWKETSYPGYYVNKLGQVLGRQGTILKPWISGTEESGYLTICISRYPDKPKKVYVHRLMAETYLGAPSSQDLQVAHNNGDKFDNSIENLRWATAKENANDKVIHGTALETRDIKGELNPKAVLKESQVLEIYRSSKSIEDLAIDFNISKSTIRDIKKGRSWKRVTNHLDLLEKHG